MRYGNWNNQAPQRFRCHTGHPYSESTLIVLQVEKVEDAAWTAMRALQERKMHMRIMTEGALASERFKESADHSLQAGEAERSAEVLRDMIMLQLQKQISSGYRIQGWERSQLNINSMPQHRSDSIFTPRQDG